MGLHGCRETPVSRSAVRLFAVVFLAGRPTFESKAYSDSNVGHLDPRRGHLILSDLFGDVCASIKDEVFT